MANEVLFSVHCVTQTTKEGYEPGALLHDTADEISKYIEKYGEEGREQLQELAHDILFYTRENIKQYRYKVAMEAT